MTKKLDLSKKQFDKNLEESKRRAELKANAQASIQEKKNEHKVLQMHDDAAIRYYERKNKLRDI